MTERPFAWDPDGVCWSLHNGWTVCVDLDRKQALLCVTVKGEGENEVK